MSAKAVYQSGVLAVYVTQKDMDVLLEKGTMEVDLLAGGQVIDPRGVLLSLFADALNALRLFVIAERGAVAAGGLAAPPKERKVRARPARKVKVKKGGRRA